MTKLLKTKLPTSIKPYLFPPLPKNISPKKILECGFKEDGHAHLAMSEYNNKVRKVFASGEVHCYFDNNKIKIKKLTNIAGTFRTSSEEHAQRIQDIFRKNFGSLEGVIYVNKNPDKTYEETILNY